jgi:hypothetical protein
MKTQGRWQEGRTVDKAFIDGAGSVTSDARNVSLCLKYKVRYDYSNNEATLQEPSIVDCSTSMRTQCATKAKRQIFKKRALLYNPRIKIQWLAVTFNWELCLLFCLQHNNVYAYTHYMPTFIVLYMNICLLSQLMLQPCSNKTSLLHYVTIFKDKIGFLKKQKFERCIYFPNVFFLNLYLNLYSSVVFLLI